MKIEKDYERRQKRVKKPEVQQMITKNIVY